MAHTPFQFGDWVVDPASNSLQSGSEMRVLEPLAMDVLLELCKHSGTVLSAEALLTACWATADVNDNVVHKIVAKLRRALDDSSTKPRFIETIRKRGYRTIMAVTPMPPAVPDYWREGSPFRGLDAFRETDAPIFFGRGEAVRKLTATVNAQIQCGRSMVLVLGPSGSGKTSLVRAGLLPALLAQTPETHSFWIVSATVLDLGEIGEHSLFTALGSTLLDLEHQGAPLFSGESGSSLGRQLRQDCASVLASLPRSNAHWCLFLDRFEAILGTSQLPAPDLHAFLEVLEQLASSGRMLVLIASRNDFYQHLAACPQLMTGKANGAHFDLTPPSPAELAQIIRLPAQAAGLHFGVDVATQTRLDDELCLAAANRPDALPLLQHTLQELYHLRSSDGELVFDVYRRLGGVEGAIGQRAQEILAKLPEQQRLALPSILSLLVSLPGNEEVVVSRSARTAVLSSAAQRGLVAALVEERLFKSELVDGVASFGLAHDALLRRWPLVSEWIEEHRNALRVQARIRLLAARWVDAECSSDLLLPDGVQLKEAQALLALGVPHLSTEETALITSSHRRARYRERTRQATAGLVLLLAALAAALGLSAISAKHVAQQRRTEAEGLMGFMLGDFVEKLRPMGRLDLLDSVSTKALGYLSISSEDELTAASLTQRATALQLIAEVRVARGMPEAALEALNTAQRLLARELRDHGDNWDVVKNLGANAFWHGQIYVNQGAWPAAEAAFRNYLAYSDQLFKIAPDKVESRIEQSYAHTNLGSLALKRGMALQAAGEFEQSIALKMRALERQPGNPTLTAELANSLSWLGSTRETLGNLHDAMETYSRELKIVSAMHEVAPSEALWASRMAFTLQRRSRVRIALGENAAAIDDISKAELTLSAVVLREPGNQGWRANLATIQLDKLRSMKEQLPLQEQLVGLRAVAEQADSLLKVDPKKADWLRLQALADLGIGRVYLELQRAPEAQAYAEKSLRRLSMLKQLNPADIRTTGDLGRSLLVISAIADFTGQHGAALSACRQASKILAGEAPHSTDYLILEPWVRAQFCLGQTATGSEAAARLSRIDYHDKSYLFYLTHLLPKESHVLKQPR